MPTAATDTPTRQPPPMGLAVLMRRAFAGDDMMPVARGLIERLKADGRDADALMDLSVILMLQGLADAGLATQARALQIRRLHALSAIGEPLLRVLAIMTPGDLMTNAPLPFLLEDAGVELRLLYVSAHESLPLFLPEHDVLVMAISESDATQALLHRLDDDLRSRGLQVLNRPARIARTSRTEASEMLAGVPGIVMPPTLRVERAALATAIVAGIGFPCIVRPTGSHASRGLSKIDGPDALVGYLRAEPAPTFYVSRFVDYSGADGLFRKARIALVDNAAFAAHMAVSAHWMVHYLNAGMAEDAARRAEESRFFDTFADDFGRRHAEALHVIAERFGLDYLVIDCAETRDGDLLVFEVDPGAVVHAMDPVDLFGYKQPHMRRIFDAYLALLMSRR